MNKSIFVSVVAIVLYLSIFYLIPSNGVLGADSQDEAEDSDNTKREYLTDFDQVEPWKIDFEIYDIFGNELDGNLDNSYSIQETSLESYSGDYSLVFGFRNFTGSGAIWLERKLPVDHYTDYNMIIEYYVKLALGSVNSQAVKPIFYFGKDNPDSVDDFYELNYFFNTNWSNLGHDEDISTDEEDNYWFAFGIYVKHYQPSTQPKPGGTSSGLYFSCFVDDVKITIKEIEPDISNRLIIYLKAALMFFIGCILIFLAIRKEYEPLLLLPIGSGIILANIPFAGLMEPGGIIYLIYQGGIKTGLFPLLIFLGIGAMTDFGPMLANPKTSLLGAAAQFGIFTTLIGAILLGFTLPEASSIGIIGGADGPTAIYTSIRLAPHLLGPIAIAAYSYMALVPIIQPPIIHWLTTEDERRIKMKQMRFVSTRERILFPVGVILICAFLLPAATPLVGMLMFGNLLRESGVVQRLANAASNELINIVTIFLGVSVGATMVADTFLTYQTIAIILLGLAAFSVGTMAGVIFGKLMCKFSKDKINPMIGAAGVSAVPMAARVVQKEGVKLDPTNHLLMHAMGPNVAGVLGSAIAAGVLIAFVGT